MQIASKSVQIASKSVQIASKSVQIAPKSVQIASKSVHIASKSVQIASKSVQIASNYDKMTTESLQIESDWFQIESDWFQIESEGMQIESEGMQIESDWSQIKSDWFQIKSDWLQIKSDWLQIRLRLTLCHARVILLTVIQMFSISIFYGTTLANPQTITNSGITINMINYKTAILQLNHIAAPGSRFIYSWIAIIIQVPAACYGYVEGIVCPHSCIATSGNSAGYGVALNEAEV